jgi:hypothetical protein
MRTTSGWQMPHAWRHARVAKASTGRSCVPGSWPLLGTDVRRCRYHESTAASEQVFLPRLSSHLARTCVLIICMSLLTRSTGTRSRVPLARPGEPVGWRLSWHNRPCGQSVPGAACPPLRRQTRVWPERVWPAGVWPAGVWPARVWPARVWPARVWPARVWPARVWPARVRPERATSSAGHSGQRPRRGSGSPKITVGLRNHRNSPGSVLTAQKADGWP